MSGWKFWLKDVGEVLMDDTHVVLTHEQFESVNQYDSIGQPTNPSIGRVFRTRGGLFVTVEPDPEPGYVRRVGRVPLFLDGAR